jgi:HD-GYP domain-containing protein (c-di-GMP phosphodiesterase class II)
VRSKKSTGNVNRSLPLATRPTSSATQLDLPARTVAVADVYEALTANRPYRAPLHSDAALALMAREPGSRVCPDAFDALEASIIQRYE